jgi:hypothetical protein
MNPVVDKKENTAATNLKDKYSMFKSADSNPSMGVKMIGAVMFLLGLANEINSETQTSGTTSHPSPTYNANDYCAGPCILLVLAITVIASLAVVGGVYGCTHSHCGNNHH